MSARYQLHVYDRGGLVRVEKFTAVRPCVARATAKKKLRDREYGVLTGGVS